MNNRTYVLMVTIPQREIVLEQIINSLYNQVEEIRIVFNNYVEIPKWVKEKSKIVPLLNTPDKRTSNAIWLLMEGVEGYVFTCDDDLIYPSDYVCKMIETLRKYENKAVLSMYGEIAYRPFVPYLKGRSWIGFEREIEQDTFVDIIGTGCALFHTDVIKPNINDFPDVYSRDLWFSIYIHRKGVPIIRIQSKNNWFIRCEVPTSPEIKNIWRKDPKLSARREEVFTNILVPLLKDKDKRARQ